MVSAALMQLFMQQYCTNYIEYTMLKLKGLNCSLQLIITKSIVDEQCSWQVRGDGKEYIVSVQWQNEEIYTFYLLKKKDKVRNCV